MQLTALRYQTKRGLSEHDIIDVKLTQAQSWSLKNKLTRENMARYHLRNFHTVLSVNAEV